MRRHESMQLQPGSITVTSDIWGVAEVSAILSCAIGNVAAVQSIIFSKEAFGDTFEGEKSIFSLFD